ncbi:MAG: hypothetical protein B7Z69_07670 [Actinobacteria bacterium 21-73-9]|nr:MAG: hypothetical protein B7Z69_07670 [Actinobacteria bacterium 21-73-9]
MRPGAMVLDALGATGKTRPRVCVLETAAGDPTSSYAMSFEAFAAVGCDVTWFRVFPQPSADPFERLGGSDLVWVGGGSVANLLALWRLHGVDAALRDAWEAGVILGGVSAGSICWHVGGPTDSFGPTLAPVRDGLALVPYGNGVHYDSEAQRRPLLQRLVADGSLPTSYATDDHVGLWYEGDVATRVVADVDVDPATGPAAYRVERSADGAVETRVGVGGIFA